MFEKYRMLIAPITLIIISLIMNFSNSNKLSNVTMSKCGFPSAVASPCANPR